MLTSEVKPAAAADSLVDRELWKMRLYLGLADRSMGRLNWSLDQTGKCSRLLVTLAAKILSTSDFGMLSSISVNGTDVNMLIWGWVFTLFSPLLAACILCDI